MEQLHSTVINAEMQEFIARIFKSTLGNKKGQALSLWYVLLWLSLRVFPV